VRDADARLRNLLGQPRGERIDRANVRADPEHLAASAQLSPDGAERDVLLERSHVGEHGVTVLGGRVDHRELSDAG
jgi:hypothetical protein